MAILFLTETIGHIELFYGTETYLTILPLSFLSHTIFSTYTSRDVDSFSVNRIPLKSTYQHCLHIWLNVLCFFDLGVLCDFHWQLSFCFWVITLLSLVTILEKSDYFKVDPSNHNTLIWSVYMVVWFINNQGTNFLVSNHTIKKIWHNFFMFQITIKIH